MNDNANVPGVPDRETGAEPAHTDGAPPMSDRQRKKTMATVVALQCFGVLGLQAFDNGFMYSFLSKWRFGEGTIMYLLSAPFLMIMFLTPAAAYVADRVGKKRTAYVGQGFSIAAFFILVALSVSFDGQARRHIPLLMSLGGVLLFGIGQTLFSCGWFALLQPIIPATMRGRFFGTLRLSWQGASIVFYGFVAWYIHAMEGSAGAFSIILGLIALALVVRMVLYTSIPELEPPHRDGVSFFKATRYVLRVPDYMPFCCYLFLLMLFTGFCPVIFSLLQEHVLGYSADQIIMLGNALLVGSVGGFYLGGRLSDRLGPKTVFIICHFSYGAILSLFVVRGCLPEGSLFAGLALLSFGFGMIKAMSSISITSQMMNLLPATNKSLGTAIAFTLMYGGRALGGIISGKVLDLKLLNESWSMGMLRLSQYDSILLGCAVMIVLLVVTLGLLPPAHKIASRGVSLP